MRHILTTLHDFLSQVDEIVTVKMCVEEDNNETFTSRSHRDETRSRTKGEAFMWLWI